MMQGRILIVEDERIVAEDLKLSLERLGLTVCGLAAASAEAVALAERHRPSLVLTDIVLRGTPDGIETARRIRESVDAGIVFLTAYADRATVERAKTVEPLGYLFKPFDDRSLETTLEVALYKHDMERKVREQEAWLEATLRSIDDAVVATDERGLVSFLNPTAALLCGWSEADAVGRPVAEVVRVVTGEGSHEQVVPVMDLGAPADLLLVARDGTKRPIHGSAAPIRDRAGRESGTILVLRDVTEQRQARDQLIRAQKLESLGVLAGGIAHDFNNLLTVILGNVSLGMADAPPGTQLHDVLAKAEGAALHCVNLTRQFLTFAKGGSPVRKVLSLGSLLGETVALALGGSRIRCTVEAAADLRPVEVDRGQVGQVFHNLLINAAQAMPSGGSVRVRAWNVPPGDLRGLPLAEGAYVAAAVQDEGLGIPEKLLPRLFEPYFSTKQRGSGLGLATSHAIILRHHGHIDVASRQGVGTTFTVYLPATDKPLPSAAGEEGSLHRGQGRILVMDDEEDIRTLAATVLGGLGYEAATAKDGTEALELFARARDEGRPFAAVILDLTVPGGMGGAEAVRRIRDLEPAARVLVSSGYANDPVLADHEANGFCGAIPKPYRAREMAEALYLALRPRA